MEDFPLEEISIYQNDMHDTELKGLVNACWNEAQKLLRHVPATHPYFTSHGPDHAYRLCIIIDQAVKPYKSSLKLSDQEIYILLLSTLLHDIGMVGEAGMSIDSAARVRREHHLRSYNYIITNWKTLYIKPGYQFSIAEVASAHRKLSIDKDITETPVQSGLPIPRTKLCAALLRLADELHITSDRVPEDYASLKLPESSAEHFASHSHTWALSFFDSNQTIGITVEIPTEQVDVLLQQAKQKIGFEFNLIRGVLASNGIDYAKIEWFERREQLIKRKTIFSLLKKSPQTFNELLSTTKEPEEELAKFLRVHGSGTPFEEVADAASKQYTLSFDMVTWESLLTQFLYSPENNYDALVFCHSKLTQKILTDEYLNRLLSSTLSKLNELKAAKRIIRESPSALRHVIENSHDLQKRSLGGGGGLFRLLVGMLENDLNEYPDLLLSPGLIDDVFQDGIYDRKAWENWKIRQAYKYHEAFPLEIILGQWLIPNEWEVKAKRLEEHTTHKFNLSMTLPKELLTYLPDLLFAASKRIGFQLEIFATNNIKLETRITTIDKANEIKENVEAVTFSAMSSEDFFEGSRPYLIIKEKVGTYWLEPEYDELPRVGNWTGPLCAKLVFHRHSQKTGQKVNLTLTAQLNLDLLDCVQAETLLEMSSLENYTLGIRNPRCPGAVIGPISVPKEQFINLAYEDEFIAIISTLAAIQNSVGKPIPFPFKGIPEPFLPILQKIGNLGNTDLKIIYEKLNAIDKQTKPNVSPFVVEVLSGEYVLERYLLDSYWGLHWPRASVQFSEDKLSNAEEILEKAFEDPKCSFSIDNVISLSPEAAIQYIKDKPWQPKDGIYHLHPSVISDKIAKSIADARTSVKITWLEESENFWYKITTCKCEFTQWSHPERWLQESKYLSMVANDNNRAYFAAKEAQRIDHCSLETQIGFGWAAFLVDRIDEAIKSTKTALKISSGKSCLVCLINTGLFYLRKAVLQPSEEKQALDNARKFYKDAIDLLLTFNEKDRGWGVEEGIRDIQQFREILHNECNIILVRFKELRSQSGLEI
jgi:hypothetical protein